MVDRFSQLDHTKVTRALSHVLFASRAFELTIDGTEMRIVGAFFTRSQTLIIPGIAY